MTKNTTKSRTNRSTRHSKVALNRNGLSQNGFLGRTRSGWNLAFSASETGVHPAHSLTRLFVSKSSLDLSDHRKVVPSAESHPVQVPSRRVYVLWAHDTVDLFLAIRDPQARHVWHATIAATSIFLTSDQMLTASSALRPVHPVQFDTVQALVVIVSDVRL